LLGALALHALALLVHARCAPTRAVESQHVEELFEIDELAAPAAEPESAPSPNTDAAALAHAEPAPAAASLRAVSARAPEGASSQSPSADPSSDVAASEAVASAASSAGEPARKIDFGLDGHFFWPPAPGEAPPAPSDPRAANDRRRSRDTQFQRRLEADLAAADVAHGDARGNALVGSLHTAVRDNGPVRGEALFRITLGADGSVGSVEILRGSEADWAPALASFRALAAKKRVRVPAGARGLRVTFAVKAKVQMPAGDEVGGAHVATPSTEPNGMTLHGTFDLADLGGGAQRLVYARVVSEEVL
jgi:hypothetical protein